MASSPFTKGPVGVLWDFENASVPRGVSGLYVAKRFQEVFSAYGPVLSILAIGNVSLLSQDLQTDLTLGAIKLVNAKALPNEKDVADKLLMTEMFLWALDHPPPSTIVLISADVDFATSISALKLRGYNMVLVPPKTVSRRMMELPNSIIHWTTVCQPVRSAVGARQFPSDHGNDYELDSAPSSSITHSASQSGPQFGGPSLTIAPSISLSHGSSSPFHQPSHYAASAPSTPMTFPREMKQLDVGDILPDVQQLAIAAPSQAAPTQKRYEPAMLGDEADSCNELDLLDVCLSFAAQGLGSVLLSRVGLEMNTKYPNYRKGVLAGLVDSATKSGWAKREGLLGHSRIVFDVPKMNEVWEKS